MIRSHTVDSKRFGKIGCSFRPERRVPLPHSLRSRSYACGHGRTRSPACKTSALLITLFSASKPWRHPIGSIDFRSVHQPSVRPHQVSPRPATRHPCRPGLRQAQPGVRTRHLPEGKRVLSTGQRLMLPARWHGVKEWGDSRFKLHKVTIAFSSSSEENHFAAPFLIHYGMDSFRGLDRRKCLTESAYPIFRQYVVPTYFGCLDTGTIGTGSALTSGQFYGGGFNATTTGPVFRVFGR